MRVVLLLPIVLFMGCAATMLKPPRAEQLQLLPPAEMASELLLKQLVVLEAEGRTQQFMVVTRIQRERVKSVVLSAVGIRLLSLEYDGDAFFQQNDLSITIPGKEILAIIQFAVWPENSVKRHYPQREGWTVIIDGKQRALFWNDRPFLKFESQGEILTVDNYLHSYRVKIDTLDVVVL